MSKEKVPTRQLRESLLDLAWDCQSQWLGSGGVDDWSEERIRMVSSNIIESLTKINKEVE